MLDKLTLICAAVWNVEEGDEGSISFLSKQITQN